MPLLVILIFQFFVLLSVTAQESFLQSVRELDIGARASLAYDSNIFGISSNVYADALSSSSTKEELESRDDFILNFSPSVHFSKKVYLIDITGSAGLSITRYIKNSKKSFIVPVTTLSLDFDESLKKRLSTNAKIRFDATFDIGQHVDTSIIEQDLVSYTYLSLSANVRYNHSRKFGIGGGTSYTFKDYQSGAIQSYSDLSILPLSLRSFYIYSEKLDIYSEYSHTRSISKDDSVNAADSATHSLNFGLNGEYSPKLAGKLGFGYAWQDYEWSNISDTSDFVTTIDLSWTHNSKTSSNYFVNRQFSPSAQGTSMLNTSLGVRFNHKLTDQVRGFSTASFSDIKYVDKVNNHSNLDQLGFGIGIDYNLQKSIIIGSSYNYNYIETSKESYDRHTFEIYASGRF